MSDLIRRGIEPGTFEELMSMAKAVSETDIVPKQFQGKPAACFAAMQMGMEIGLAPMTSLNAFHVISGQCGIKPKAALGLVISRGGLYDYSETFEGEGDSLVCIVRGKRRGVSESFLESRFSMADAKRAEYTKNPKYRTEPKRMLRARAVGYFVNDFFQDVILGISVADADLIDSPPSDSPQPVQVAAAVNPIIAASQKLVESVTIEPTVNPDCVIPVLGFNEMMTVCEGHAERYKPETDVLTKADFEEIIASFDAAQKDIRTNWYNALHAYGMAQTTAGRVSILLARDGVVCPPHEPAPKA